MARIYLASSWRNEHHARFYGHLRLAGHEVYDFKASERGFAGGPSPTAFSWEELDTNWKTWTPEVYRDRLIESQRAASGFLGDFRGMEWADTCVMLLPCGRSAHTEAGYMKGRGKRLIVAYPNSSTEGFDPDLMYLLADNITVGSAELLKVVGAT